MSTMHLPRLEYLTVQQAAEVIGCTGGRVRQMLLAGELQGVKFNARAWMIPKKSAAKMARTPRPVGRPKKIAD
jgi:excisionase family DNA binding protein